MSDIKTITVDGKQYERRRYDYEELKRMFDGRVVILEDAVYKNMNPVSGILLDVCNANEKRKRRLEYLKSSDKKFTFWDFTPAPILIGYKEII